jgi:type I restriction enzyme M protein
VLAVVSLPAGVFKPYAGVKTAVLVFRRPVREKKTTEKVWFYEIKNDGFDPDKIAGGGRPETPGQNDIPALLAAWDQFKGTNFATPPGPESGSLLPAGSPEPTCWWATRETLAGNDYNLAAGRYKPQVTENRAEEDPAELIQKTLVVEREIVTSLEKLLGEFSKS